MNLLKTSVLNGVAVLIKTATMFLLNKILAVYVGPAGYAAIGQFQNFIQMITTFAGSAVNTAVVKYTAEYQDIEEKKKIFSSSIVISLICSLIISIFLFTFSGYLSELILKDIQYSSVFIIFGATIFLFALNMVLISILNGQKEIKKYILVNIASSIFSLFFTSFLIMQLNLMGALYALVVNQSVIFFVTTLPEPITTLSQIDTGSIVAFDPIETLFPIVVLFQRFLSPLAGPPVENRSLINITP